MNEITTKIMWFIVMPLVVVTAAMNITLLKIYMVLIWIFALGLSVSGK